MSPPAPTTRIARRTRAFAAAAVAASLALGPPAGAGHGVTDAEITQAIDTRLFLDDAVSAHGVDVATSEGVTTLSGTVSNLLAHDRAVEIARSTKGVRAVVDLLATAPEPRSDEAILGDVEQALLADPAAEAFEVDVGVNDAIVTLAGTVDSWAERMLAGEVVASVRGVREVDNGLEVEIDPDRSDRAILADVRGRMASSVWIDDRFIEVAVDDGRVTLTGVVGSDLEKQRAIDVSWGAGVRAVRSDDLKVDWWARNAMRRERRFVERTPAQIRAAVQDALAADPRVSAFDVGVTAVADVVTLAGVVESAQARRAAERDAWNAVGVRRVRNFIRVRPDGKPTDAEVTGLVRDALARDPYIDSYDVAVSVVNGEVTLAGDVNTTFERSHAGDVAARVRGVVEVNNELAAAHRWRWRPDLEIRRDVEEQLFWSPFVDSDGIQVEVHDGVVTLAGAVASWAEWRSAAENAFEGGAKDVRNRIQVGS